MDCTTDASLIHFCQQSCSQSLIRCGFKNPSGIGFGHLRHLCYFGPTHSPSARVSQAQASISTTEVHACPSAVSIATASISLSAPTLRVREPDPRVRPSGRIIFQDPAPRLFKTSGPGTNLIPSLIQLLHITRWPGGDWRVAVRGVNVRLGRERRRENVRICFAAFAAQPIFARGIVRAGSCQADSKVWHYSRRLKKAV